MSNLSAFLSQNAIQVENEKYIASDRFVVDGEPIEWEIQAIDEDLNESIRKACTSKTRDKKTRQVSEKLDHGEYVTKLMVECIVFPNLKDRGLQESYGVLGAEKLIKKMLTSGEFANLLEKIQEVNGFDEDDEELVEEAKN